MRQGKLVNDVKKLKRNTDIWTAGKLGREKLKSFVEIEADNLEIILTGERRKHYLKVKGREKIKEFERDISKIIEYPDKIYKNGRHENTVWFLKELDKTHFLKLVIKLVKTKGELKHSILTFHPVRKKRLKKFRKNLIWEVKARI